MTGGMSTSAPPPLVHNNLSLGKYPPPPGRFQPNNGRETDKTFLNHADNDTQIDEHMVPDDPWIGDGESAFCPGKC